MNINIDNNFIKIDHLDGNIYISFMPQSVRNLNKLNLKSDNLKALVFILHSVSQCSTQCYTVFDLILNLYCITVKLCD